MIFYLVLLVVLFLLSAFFSSSEAALTALSSLKMKRLAVIQPSLARYFSEWLSKPHRLLVTILVGNNVVNLAISSVAVVMALPLAQHVPVRLLEFSVWLVTSIALVALGEVIPKIVGRVYRERLSAWTLPILSGMTRSAYFLLQPIHLVMERFLPVGNKAPVSRLTALSLEELFFIVSESQATGQVPRESGEMMNRALALSQRTAQDIQQPWSQADAVALEVLDRGAEATELFVDLLVESGRTRVPVTRAGVPVGTIHVMDLLKEWRTGRVGSLENLIRPPRLVAPSRGVAELLADFRTRGEHLMFVETDAGECLGLITLEDVLEEIVGDILDEYDWEKKKP